ncbi:MAG: hypothetical protein MJZ19_09430 [Paludibacteraceae bacterium]|nr:hypothetical protein [Paludibacteraceae bacterium]
MLDNIIKKYYIRIAITALTIFAGAIYANQSISIPSYVTTIVYLMLLTIVPYAVWNFGKKMKMISQIEDKAIRERNIKNANMIKMLLIYVPTMLCSVLYFTEPTESSLGVAIISLILFLLFAKPTDKVA